MGSIDITTLINWITAGLLGFLFGIISSWITYRYERKRDDIAWEREKELLELKFNLKIKEIEEQIKKEGDDRLAKKIREIIMGGAIPPVNINAAVKRVRREISVFDKGESPMPMVTFSKADLTGLDIVPSVILGILYINKGPQRGGILRIKDGTVIGRTDGDIILDDPKLSTSHARLTLEEDRFVIRDLGSQNGTFVNGERVEVSRLEENDTILMGESTFVLKTLKPYSDFSDDKKSPLDINDANNIKPNTLETEIGETIICQYHGPFSSKNVTCPFCREVFSKEEDE